MGYIILFAMLASGPVQKRYADAETACKAVALEYSAVQTYIYRIERDDTERQRRVAIRCLPPVVIPEHTEQITVPERTEYPSEDVRR